MKRVIILFTILIVAVSCNKKNEVIIRGTYPEGAGTSLRLEMLNISQVHTIDSTKISKKGHFRFSFELDNPELVLLKNDQGDFINLLAFPGDRIGVDVTGDDYVTDYNITGSEESEKIKMLVTHVEQTKFQLDSLEHIADSLAPDDPRVNVLMNTWKQTFERQKKFNIRFIVEHLTSLASVYACYQRIGPDQYILNDLKDIQYLKIVSDSVKVRYPHSTLVTSLVQDVTKKIQNYNNLLAISKVPKDHINTTGLINLEIRNRMGKVISLSSLQGKVILLNFWASWDQNSRVTNRRLKSVYNKYHSRGFEVYSVSMDNNRGNWIQAIDFEEYKWIDVCELTYPKSYAAQAYNVQGLPTNYLIDREGNILAKNLSPSVLSTWLDNLL